MVWMGASRSRSESRWSYSICFVVFDSEYSSMYAYIIKTWLSFAMLCTYGYWFLHYGLRKLKSELCQSISLRMWTPRNRSPWSPRKTAMVAAPLESCRLDELIPWYPSGWKLSPIPHKHHMSLTTKLRPSRRIWELGPFHHGSSFRLQHFPCSMPATG